MAERYLNDLLDMETYLTGLQEVITACEAAAENSEFLSQYAECLEALRIKQHELLGDVREFVRKRPTDPASSLLSEMLDKVEPLCREVIQTLSRLSSSPVEPEAEAQGLNNDDDLLEHVGLEQRLTLTDPVTDAAPSDVRDTDPNDARDVGASAADASHAGRQTVESATDLDETEVKQLQKTRSQNSPEEDYTSFVIISSSEAEQERPRKPANDEWIPLCFPPANDGHKPLKYWSDAWEEQLRAKNKSGTTRWTVDRQAAIAENQASAKAGGQAEEYLMAVFDKYKHAKDNELMRDFMVTFDTMIGSDRGALSREFFYLTFEACVSGMYKGQPLMIGDRGRLIPNNDDSLMDANAFKCLGVMIAHAVRHGCRGLPGVSPVIKYYLVRGQGQSFSEDDCPPVSIDDVYDDELYRLLAKLESGANLTSKDEKVLRMWMHHGGHHIHVNEQTRHLVIQKLLIDYVYKQRRSQIDAIAEGMERYKLQSFLFENPTKENISFVFPSNEDVTVDPDLFMAAVITRGDSFDQSTLEFLQQFLRDLLDGKIENKSVADLVQFVSGSPYLPERVIVSFNNSAKHPTSHACFNEIELPTTHLLYDGFRDAMVYALRHGMEFSRE